MITYKQLMESLKYDSFEKNQLSGDSGITDKRYEERSKLADTEHTNLDSSHTPNLQDHHYNAIHNYTGSLIHGNLNAHLHGSKNAYPLNAKAKDTHAGLMDMHKSNPALQTAHHVYSGLGNFDPRSAVHKSNGIFEHKAHLSTSINPSIAKQRNEALSDGDRHAPKHVLHITLPKGYKGGRYVAPHSQDQREREMLLKPQKFKITKSETVTHPTTGAITTIHHAKPYGNLNEAEEKPAAIPSLFASIYHKSKKRPNGYTPEELKKINDKK